MSETTAVEPVRRRPRDRRQAIEAAAASLFAEHGYHRVAMQDVADVVGISAAALYRHFDTKYDLFREVAMGLIGRLDEATRDVGGGAPTSVEEAREAVDALLDAVAGATIGMRATGGIYRWESRCLKPEDRRALRDRFVALRRRLAEPAGVLRADLEPAALDLAAYAALSAIASVTTHRTAMPAAALRAVLHDAAVRVLLEARSPAPEPGGEPEPVPRPRRRKNQLSQAGIALFAERGYHDVRLEEIAAAVGLTPSGVYRHFTGKAEILLTACGRAAAALDASAAEAFSHDDPRAALRILEGAYIRFAVDDRELMDVYAADVGALDPDDQRRLRRLQREHVDDWVELLMRVRPELEAREARCLVHAGFNVVADLSVALRRSAPEVAEEWIAPVLESVLGV
ncbi:TetR/AcrR family transcriptional regulator [Demequina iriomotensis]|uniref:TetR/AcrR family transcriptional regulator n=1 Tax=Demequina iriomotensis TaxID=1536641 RepID=UPI0007810D28|nr:TetR/AcrR family transcriptional regulator [Demequina iriomotensis]